MEHILAQSWKYSHGQRNLLNSGHTVSLFMGLMKELKCVHATWQIYCNNYQAGCTKYSQLCVYAFIKYLTHIFTFSSVEAQIQTVNLNILYTYCTFRRIQVGALSKETLLGGWRQNFKQTKEEFKGDGVTQVDNNLNSLWQKHARMTKSLNNPAKALIRCSLKTWRDSRHTGADHYPSIFTKLEQICNE